MSSMSGADDRTYVEYTRAATTHPLFKRFRKQGRRWMQDGCQSFNESYMCIRFLTFNIPVYSNTLFTTVVVSYRYGHHSLFSPFFHHSILPTVVPDFAIEITPIICYIRVVFPFMGSLSLDRYRFYFLMILKETLIFLLLSNLVLQYLPLYLSPSLTPFSPSLPPSLTTSLTSLSLPLTSSLPSPLSLSLSLPYLPVSHYLPPLHTLTFSPLSQRGFKIFLVNLYVHLYLSYAEFE